MRSTSPAQSRSEKNYTGKKFVNDGVLFTIITQTMRKYIVENAPNYYYHLNKNEQGVFADVTFIAEDIPGMRCLNLWVPFYIEGEIPIIVKTCT